MKKRLFLLLFLCSSLCAGESKPAANPMAAMFAPPPPPVVLVDKVAVINEVGARKYVGQIEAIEDVTLKIRVAGVLEKINFREGGMVNAGDLLFEIEDTTYQAQLKAAAARLEQINAELIFAEKNYKRNLELSQNKVIAESALDEATRLINLTKARQAEAEASRIDAANNLSYTRISAPISGRISKSHYTKGNYLKTDSEPLATIVQTSPIYVRFAMSEPDLISLFDNTENIKKNAVVRVRTADRKFLPETGKVTLVDNRIDSQTGTITVWATFVDKDDVLISGGLVDVTISKTTERKIPAVKVTALITNQNGHAVYVLNDDKTVSLRPVEIGGLINEMQVIENGLKEGENIIIDGTHKLRPGATVNPQFAK